MVRFALTAYCCASMGLVGKVMFAAVIVVPDMNTSPPEVLDALINGEVALTVKNEIGSAFSDAIGINTVCGEAPPPSRVSAGICSLPVTMDGPAGTVLGQPVTAEPSEGVVVLDVPAQ